VERSWPPANTRPSRNRRGEQWTHDLSVITLDNQSSAGPLHPLSIFATSALQIWQRWQLWKNKDTPWITVIRETRRFQLINVYVTQAGRQAIICSWKHRWNCYTVKTDDWFMQRLMMMTTTTTVMLIIINKKLSRCWQTHATPLQVSQGHQTWYHSICWVYGFLLVCHSNFVPKMRRFWDIRLPKCRDLEKWVRVCQGHWKCHHLIQCMWFPIDIL